MKIFNVCEKQQNMKSKSRTFHKGKRQVWATGEYKRNEDFVDSFHLFILGILKFNFTTQVD